MEGLINIKCPFIIALLLVGIFAVGCATKTPIYIMQVEDSISQDEAYTLSNREFKISLNRLTKDLCDYDKRLIEVLIQYTHCTDINIIKDVILEIKMKKLNYESLDKKPKGDFLDFVFDDFPARRDIMEGYKSWIRILMEK